MKSIVRMIYLVFFQSKYTSVYFLSQISFKDMGTPINDIYMYIYEQVFLYHVLDPQGFWPYPIIRLVCSYC